MMRKKNKKMLFAGLTLLVLFIFWTVLVRIINVEPIGPNDSKVGFAGFNGYVSRMLGVHMFLYILTDWLGLVPIGTALGFAILGLSQWIKRKSIAEVDRTLLFLGAFYIAVMTVYIIFESIVINYRPVLIDGYLEVSYPSSTTMLVMCAMPTAVIQLNQRIKNKSLRLSASLVIYVFTAFMIIGRIISGVHWITDIIGALLISEALVIMYVYFCLR